MVGGLVHEVNECDDRPGVLEVVCRDRLRPDERTAVKIEKSGRWAEIKPGDSFWWQAGKCMWTPSENALFEEESEARGHKCGVHFDIQFDKVGYSYSPETAAV